MSLHDWQPCKPLSHTTLTGAYASLQPLDAAVHAADLYHAYQADSQGELWRYLPYGPFTEFEPYREWLAGKALESAEQWYAVVDLHTQGAVGVLAYLRPQLAQGSVEIGHVCFSPRLQRTPLATEALYLMLRQVFAAGYRRCEWKCNQQNKASIYAALRLGFRFEGLWQQAAVIKGHNRNTAWFAMLDHEWPLREQVLQAWLNPNNFDTQGQQRSALSELNGYRSYPRQLSCQLTLD